MRGAARFLAFRFALKDGHGSLSQCRRINQAMEPLPDSSGHLRISVALCTYNGAAFVEEQLRSFMAQDRLPDELVVCDDRSTDHTAAIIASVAAEAPFPIRLTVNEERLGSTRNFEQACRL